VQRFDLQTRRGSVVAHLPRALSDVASATVGGVVYLVGGYDGTRPRAEIYRTADGRHFTLVASLPRGLRYPAVAAAGRDVVIAGGDSSSGPTAAVYVLDTATNKLSTLGSLPGPVGHAVAFELAGNVYVGGGTNAAGSLVGRIVRIDVAHRSVRSVGGALALRDAPAVTVGAYALTIGGANAGGVTAAVHRLR
jgi:hypothetical protein